MNRSMVWVNQKKRRFYRVIVQKDLLGDVVLYRYWGSLDSAHGGTKTELVNGDDIDNLLFSIDKLRTKKGYVNISG